ncbi:MAG: hypothetical protein HY735_11760 [Verrucomicrobia bacterium]|nr:hypothetical protein [Verrucomicrobiota bacterium]
MTNFARLPDRSFRLRLVGHPAVLHSLQASADLSSWVTLLTTNAPTGAVDFVDASGNLEKRFYRAQSLPSQVTVLTTNYHGWPNSILLSNGKVEAVLVPAVGRIMQFRLVGESGMFWENRSLDGQAPDPNSTSWKNFGGDKTWPAPQSDWPRVTGRSWPPPKGFDAVPASAGVTNGVVTITSPGDSSYGIKILRRVELEPEMPVMRVTTTFEKVSDATNRVSVWVIAQLNDPLRVFLPVPPASRFANGYTLQSSTPPAGLSMSDGLISLIRDRAAGHKIGSDAETLLWVGQSVCLRIDSARVETEDYPDNGSSVEVYTNPDPDAYVELEMLGPLRTLKVGDRIQQTTTYTLIRRTEPTPEAEAKMILSR